MGSNESSGGLGYRREKGEDFIIVFVGRLVLHAGHLTGSVFISLCLVWRCVRGAWAGLRWPGWWMLLRSGEPGSRCLKARVGEGGV